VSGTSRAVVEVYVESGAKRAFAGAVAWPGWCRSGRDESGACEALIDYAPRYRAVLAAAGVDFIPGGVPIDLATVERLDGGSTTDFGAPGSAPAVDDRPVDAADLARLTALLRACWAAFDSAAAAASGSELSKGPRGGGRSLEAIAAHVVDAEAGYLARIGGAAPAVVAGDAASLAAQRAAVVRALEASARGEVPREGPRGGRRWPARYFVRRAAWHALDHAWEIEDRSTSGSPGGLARR
jgi:DinB superfamily